MDLAAKLEAARVAEDKAAQDEADRIAQSQADKEKVCKKYSRKKT